MRRRLGACIAQYGPRDQWRADLDRAQAFGMSHVRLDIVPAYTFCGTDLTQPAEKITAARARGLKIHAMLPHWLTSDKVQHKDGSSLTQLGTFTQRVVGELGSEIDSYELGNEPDIAIPFAPDGVDPEYQAAVSAAMVRYLPVGARICSPGLAPASNETKDGKVLRMAPADFAARYWGALDTATRRRITGNGIHLYGTPADIAQTWSTYHQLPAISAAGRGRPLEVTECNGDPKRDAATIATQAEAAFGWLRATSIPIGRVFVYELSDQPGEVYPYGAYATDGTERPLAAVLEREGAR